MIWDTKLQKRGEQGYLVAICQRKGACDLRMQINVRFCLDIINLALKRKPAGNFEKQILFFKFVLIIVLLTTIFMKRLTNFISSLCRNEVAILCGALTLLLAGGATIPASGQSPDGETVVSGKVTSKATKDPLAGVVIYIEGTSFNTTTDSEGNYSFSFVPKEGTQIKFYFLGMEDYSVAYTGQKTIDVTLQEASESLGINISGTKIRIYMIGAFIAGFAGAFYAHYMNILTPTSVLGTALMTQYVAMCLIGGLGTIVGPVFGAFLITTSLEVLRKMEDYRMIIYGLLIIITIIFLREGVWGTFKNFVLTRAARKMNDQT